MDKKFIIVDTKELYDRMIANGFQFVSHIGDQYIFINKLPENFQFSDIDHQHLIYSNIFSL